MYANQILRLFEKFLGIFCMHSYSIFFSVLWLSYLLDTSSINYLSDTFVQALNLDLLEREMQINHSSNPLASFLYEGY